MVETTNSKSVLFYICENRNCGQQWAAAAHFEDKAGAPSNPIPMPDDPKDINCPECGNDFNILDSWGQRGCTIKKEILPGHPIKLGTIRPG